jgi:hypothetical protein
MHISKMKSIIVAGALAMGIFSATSGTASAEVFGGIYYGGPGFSIGISSGGYGQGYGRRDRHRPHYRGNRCRPGKAVSKARSRGIRRAHVVRVGHRGVVVAGRKWGERVVIGFGRSHRCPVRYVRAR